MKFLVTLCIAGIATAVNLKQYEVVNLTDRELFDAMDADNNGELEGQELKQQFIDAGWTDESASNAAKQLIGMGDSNKDGKVTFEEFEYANK